MKIPTRAAVALLFAFLGASPSSAQVPAGGEMSITTGFISHASVAMDSAGNFVVVWSYGDVTARLYDAAGNPRGPDFRVNSYTTGFKETVSVASDAAGNFVVVWTHGAVGTPPESQDGSESGVFAQRYDSAGSPRGSEFRVNTFTPLDQRMPSVASDAAGNFVVVWTSDRQDGSGRGIFAQRYKASGSADGPEFIVNSSIAGDQTSPVVASDPMGNFVIAWRGASGAVAGQRYDASGATLGSEFQVAAAGAPGSVAMTPEGAFVVAWTAYDADSLGVFIQRYGPSGAPLGGPFQVSSTATGDQWDPAVSMDGAGGFVVVWTHTGGLNPLISSEIRAQRYDATGTPRGIEFRVDGAYLGPGWPAVASDTSGNFVVVWDDSQSQRIVAQRFGGLSPAPSRVDAQASANSDGNGVLEPGESVEVKPFWRNINGAPQTFDGGALAFSGPAASGISYELQDALASYGTVPNGTTAPCSDCYGVAVPFEGTRPAIHWDATLEERLTPDVLGQTSRWALHVGDSFTDVPRTSAYYRFVETLLHKGVTGGCQPASFCPAATVTREQLAVFVLLAKEGAHYMAPDCGAPPMFADVPVTSPSCRWVEELARRGVVTGCDGGNYCPSGSVTREQMAVILLLTLEGPVPPPACVSPTRFADVPETSPYCPWVEELARRGVVTGCGGGNYCPSGSVTREQMAVFISGTFGLTLYGP